MKYIRLFEDFVVNDTDQPDVKMSKERLNTIQKQIKEYQQKKASIDTLYTSTRDVKVIEDELRKLLGDTDVKNGVDRNPFLVEYVQVTKLKSDIENLSKDNIMDKVKLDDFKRDVIATTDNNLKTSLTNKINEIDKRMKDRVSKISQISIELEKSEKLHKERIIKVDKDIKEFTKKVI